MIALWLARYCFSLGKLWNEPALFYVYVQKKVSSGWDRSIRTNNNNERRERKKKSLKLKKTGERERERVKEREKEREKS